MILNHDCFRAVLLYIEEKCVYEDTKFGRRMHEVSYSEICNAHSLQNYSVEDKSYIITILFEGGFIAGYTIPPNSFRKFRVKTIVYIISKRDI